MLEPGCDLDFPQETLRAEDVGQLRAKHRAVDHTAVLEVAGEIDRGHASAPKLALECVVFAQGVGQ
jgi:hypothetical protein